MASYCFSVWSTCPSTIPRSSCLSLIKFCCSVSFIFNSIFHCSIASSYFYTLVTMFTCSITGFLSSPNVKVLVISLACTFTYLTQLDKCTFLPSKKSSVFSFNSLIQIATCSIPLSSAYVCALSLNFLYYPAIGIPVSHEITIFLNSPLVIFPANSFPFPASFCFVPSLPPPFLLLLNCHCWSCWRLLLFGLEFLLSLCRSSVPLFYDSRLNLVDVLLKIYDLTNLPCSHIWCVEIATI